MEKGQGKGTDTLPTDNVFTRKEYIEREAALNALCYGCCENGECEIECAMWDAIASIPAADVAPVRHGRWKKVDDGIYYHMECSECGCRPLRNRWVDDNELSLFCPNCGARMDGDGDA